jgi:tripartite ATP-independent transporter DctM subunit
MELALIIILFLGLLLVGMPVLVAMGFPSLLYVLVRGMPLSMMPYVIIQSIDSFPILAVPMFILLGKLITEFGGSERIFNFARLLLRDVRGYSAYVTVIANLIFAGISGAALAEIGGLGELEIKAMEDEGYTRSFGAALTGAAAIVGPIFPPSIPLVVYAMVAEVSSVKALVAGALPGIVISACLLVYAMGSTRSKLKIKRHIGEVNSSKESLFRSFWDALPTLMAVPFILIGMLTGIFSPTEAGAAGVFYAMVIGAIHRRFTFVRIVRALKETLISVSSVLIIVAMGTFFTRVLSLERAPELVTSTLLGFSRNPIVILIIINIVLLIVGCFMEGLSALVLLVPIFLPVTNAIGVDPIHLGIIVVYNIMIGILTPPFGLGLYMVCGVGKVSPDKVVRELLPMFVPLLVALLVLTFVPQFSLWLPSLIFQK